MEKRSPILTGLMENCPQCGHKSIWQTYLTFKDNCDVCNLDFKQTDTADGPAFFVGFLVMILFVPFGFIIPMASQPVWWKIVMMVILGVIITITTFILLPKAKSLLMTLEIVNKAKEAELDN